MQCYATLCYDMWCLTTMLSLTVLRFTVLRHNLARLRLPSLLRCLLHLLPPRSQGEEIRFVTLFCSSLRHASLLLRFDAFCYTSLRVFRCSLCFPALHFFSGWFSPWLGWSFWHVGVTTPPPCLGRRVSGAGTLAFLLCCF